MNRPFDLKAALSGEPISCKGRTYTFRSLGCSSPVVLRFYESPDVPDYGPYLGVTLDGFAAYAPSNEPLVVVMAPRKVKKTVWINFYDDNTAYYWPSKETAERAATMQGRIATAVPVEIEVEE